MSRGRLAGEVLVCAILGGGCVDMDGERKCAVGGGTEVLGGMRCVEGWVVQDGFHPGLDPTEMVCSLDGIR